MFAPEAANTGMKGRDNEIGKSHVDSKLHVNTLREQRPHDMIDDSTTAMTLSDVRGAAWPRLSR